MDSFSTTAFDRADRGLCVRALGDAISPRIQICELPKRAASEWAMAAPDRIADRNRRRRVPRIWNRKQLAHLGLAFAEERGEHASETFGAAREQQILDRRVNRSALTPAARHQSASAS